MHAHYLQHVPFEGLGSIEPWFVEHNYHITRTPLFASNNFPSLEDVDLLIILGGPMSVHDDSIHPWLTSEKAFIRAYLASGKPVLGICLGAQLIAHTLGAKVYANTEKEIGWFPVTTTSTDSTCFQFPATLNAFHWHGETFDLPQGANRLASSKACKNQAFQIGNNVLGLQFHLETTPLAVRRLVTNCRHEIIPSLFVQTEQQMLSATHIAYEAIHRELNRLLNYITRGLS